MEQKIQRIKELTQLLNRYRDEYYNQNAPTVSDAAYDRLFDELCHAGGRERVCLWLTLPLRRWATRWYRRCRR